MSELKRRLTVEIVETVDASEAPTYRIEVRDGDDVLASAAWASHRTIGPMMAANPATAIILTVVEGVFRKFQDAAFAIPEDAIDPDEPQVRRRGRRGGPLDS